MHSHRVMAQDEESVSNKIVRLIVELELGTPLKFYSQLNDGFVKNARHGCRNLSNAHYCRIMLPLASCDVRSYNCQP